MDRREPPRPFDSDAVAADITGPSSSETASPGAPGPDTAQPGDAPEATDAGERDAEASEASAAAAAPDEADDSADSIDPTDADETASGGGFDDLERLPALLEALLFVADQPIEEAYLARALEVSGRRIASALDELGESLRAAERGVRLQRGPEGAQLVSAPEAAPQIEHFLGLEASRRLSTAALETLAIIAYRQPVTRSQIDAIRGVSSDGAIATLRARGLIASAGRAPGPGRPTLLQTTQRFLEHFGLERPDELPPLPEDIELPPEEIGAQLGLEGEALSAALDGMRREPEEPAPASREDEPPDAPEDEAPAGEPASEATADPPAVSEPTPAEDAEADEASDQPAAEGEIEISDDVEALTEAASQALNREALSPRLPGIDDEP